MFKSIFTRSVCGEKGGKGEKGKFWRVLLTAENAESAEKRIHHGVTRKATDYLTADARRQTQTQDYLEDSRGVLDF